MLSSCAFEELFRIFSVNHFKIRDVLSLFKQRAFKKTNVV
jgi:hypothetical protein